MLTAGLVIAVAVLLGASAAVRVRRARRLPFVLQLIGAAALLIVGLTHVAEAGRVLTFMGWGRPHSAGHYLDLSAAILAVTLLPIGWLAGALTRRA